jgi:hypothetical protein
MARILLCVGPLGLPVYLTSWCTNGWAKLVSCDGRSHGSVDLQAPAVAQRLRLGACTAAFPSRKFSMLGPTAVPRAHSAAHSLSLRAQDWLENIMSFPKSRMLQRVRMHLLANTLWAAAVFALYHYVPQFVTVCAGFSPLPHSLTAGALALLLVRTPHKDDCV